MPRIVISYRRADTDVMAGRIRDRLADHYGDAAVFMDIDNIPFGKDFRTHIGEAVSESDVLLVVIGRRWLGATKGRQPRIAGEADFVRLEVETAMRSGVPIIPVTVGTARMPGPSQLPESLREFAFVNAAPVDTGRDFHVHMERLIRSLEDLFLELEKKNAPSPAEALSARTPQSETGISISAAPPVAFEPDVELPPAHPPDEGPSDEKPTDVQIPVTPAIRIKPSPVIDAETHPPEDATGSAASDRGNPDIQRTADPENLAGYGAPVPDQPVISVTADHPKMGALAEAPAERMPKADDAGGSPGPPLPTPTSGLSSASTSFHSVLETRPLAPPQIAVVALCTFAFITNGFLFNSAGAAASGLVGAFIGTSVSSLSWIFTVFGVGVLLGAVIGGLASDRMGRKPILIIGAGLAGVSSLLCASAGSLGIFGLMRFLTGFSTGGVIAAALTLVADFIPLRCRARSVALITAGGTAGGLLCSAAAAGAASYGILFAVGGLAEFLVLVGALLWLPESPRFLLVKHDGSDRRTNLLRVLGMADAAMASGPSLPAYIYRGSSARYALLWVLLLATLFCSAAASLCIISGLRSAGTGSEAASAAIAGAVIALLWIPCLGFLMDQFGPARVLAIGIGVTAAMMLLFMLSPNILLGSLVSAMVAGNISGAYALSTMALYSHRLGAAMGVALGVGRIGALIGTPLVSVMTPSAGWRGAFIIVALVAAVASTCAALLGRYLTRPTDLCAAT